ncbi:MAG: hypothetical protein RLZ25_748 [Pseudomonadota bacterium]
MLPGLSLLKVIQRPMLIFFTRLAPVLFVLLSACTTSPSRPPSERSSLDRPSIQVNRAPETKPSVVTVPIETGLEPVPKAPQEPVITQPSPALTQDVDTGRPSDASTSPYATPEESAVAQSALPPIEPVIEPALPTIDYQPPPDPAPIRTLSPRIGDKLFTQSAPPAVAALESDIEAQFKARRYGDAAAQIDRALRIQPKNPELWHVLAEIRLRQNQPGLAEDLAKKSNSLAKSNAELVKSNWRIIADARRQQGNGMGAQDALEKAW